ncbi:hypothetical protein [Geobacter sp. SVR]|uniref:hypothetical protein n=1 Tax=Geobacter sp. SVR TaxID=2495594 RepID=UPI00143F0051|nr:hypothetical protein [Geobacter sp. SVR]BCS52314.1 hypothetical protein GSVR_06220 [Geobacter sp. SVR]GCF85027.1 hypothetical protein GSbR_16270 [Geobacter sp. SVR]
MILNNNCLPWPMSAALKTLINRHLSERYSATVLHFDDINGIGGPVEIVIDLDGSIVMINDPNPVPLDSGSENLSRWDNDFMARYRLGSYRVEVFPLIELLEIA